MRDKISMTGCSSNKNTKSIRRALFALALASMACADARAQWTSIGGPFGGSVVALSADSQYVYVGTTQGHVWRRPISEVVMGIARQHGASQSSRLSLSGYPNPCNASTVLAVSIPEASVATLDLYDILGRRVMTVLERRLEAGSYSVPLEMPHLSSGTYFAVLQAANRRAVIRIAVIR